MSFFKKKYCSKIIDSFHCPYQLTKNIYFKTEGVLFTSNGLLWVSFSRVNLVNSMLFVFSKKINVKVIFPKKNVNFIYLFFDKSLKNKLNNKK